MSNIDKGVVFMSQRINVTVSDEVNEKLNGLSKRYGMAKSAMCAFVIGQWIDQKETADGVFKQAISDISKREE